MDLNALLPALLPAIVTLIVISVAAALALNWMKEPNAQILLRRAWVGVSVLVVVGVGVFWIANAMVGAHRPSVDRNLQQQQQDEMHQRLQNGGH